MAVGCGPSEPHPAGCTCTTPGTDQRNGTLPGQHLDFRGAGGYVLLSPSRIRTGTYTGSYTLVAKQPAPGTALNWNAVSKLLRPAAATRPLPSTLAVDSTERLAAHVARQTEGNRDNALFWAACHAAESKIANPHLLVAAAVSTGLTEQQASRTVRSAYDTIARRGTPRPRDPAGTTTLAATR